MSTELPPFVTHPAGCFHRTIDLAKLAATLANEPMPEEPRDRIVGPHDLHVFEQRRVQQQVLTDEAIPADYFIWATGEPPHRAMTKLGGVPFLPTSVPWPEREGTVGDFYAQLNFVDSKDLVPALPGDLLLVFRFNDLDEYTSWDDEAYGFVWVDAVEKELVRPEDVRHSDADANDPWPIMHGYRVRTFDNPSQLTRIQSDDTLDPRLFMGEATKIGGAPTDCESVWGPEEIPDDYRFLGQITAVWPATDVPYPVVDRAAPVGEFPDPDNERLMSGPGEGVTCLYLDSDDNVRVHFS